MPAGHRPEGHDQREECEGMDEADDGEVRAGTRRRIGLGEQRDDEADDHDQEQRPEQLGDVCGKTSVLHCFSYLLRWKKFDGASLFGACTQGCGARV